MNTLQTMRRWQHRSVLQTCAVFIAVWVNLAFQTCAMATMPTDDCPHCPPGMHDSDMPMAPMDCDVIDSIDEPNLVGPASKFDNGIADLDIAVLGGWLDLPVLLSDETILRPYRPVRSMHGPPLNVLFCVYLK